MQSFAADNACFGADARPDAFVMQQAPPPQSRNKAYAYYPASAFASMNIDAIERTDTTAPVYYWQWANHGLRPRHKANILPAESGPLRLAANFSSRALADQCTIAQTQAVLGVKTPLPPSLRALGLSAVPSGEFTDACVLPSRITAKFDGIVLDYEVFDGRTPEETRDFLLRYAAVVKKAGKSVILYTNPLDAPTQKKTGIAADTMSDIAKAFDFVTITLWSGNRQKSVPESYRSQAAMLGAETRSKGLVTFELAGTTLGDARFVRDLLKKGEVRGVNFWRNYARQGGLCDTDVNAKIRCIALGGGC